MIEINSISLNHLTYKSTIKRLILNETNVILQTPKQPLKIKNDLCNLIEIVEYYFY